jgi:hypothetical protein
LLAAKLDCKEGGSGFSNSRLSMLSLSNMPYTDEHYQAIQCSSVTFPIFFPVNHQMNSMAKQGACFGCNIMHRKSHIFQKSLLEP